MGDGTSSGGGSGTGAGIGGMRPPVSDNRPGGLLRDGGSALVPDWGRGGGGARAGGYGGAEVAAWVRQTCLEVLERLLTVGLSDEAPYVRQEIVIGLEVREIGGG